MNQQRILVGTYTSGSSRGIHCYLYDQLLQSCYLEKVIEANNPSYFTISRAKDFIYTVNENGANTANTLSAYRFNYQHNDWHLINTVSSDGIDPCHLMLSVNERYVIASNYSNGTLVVLARQFDGGLGKALQVLHFSGGSRVNFARQQQAHLHYSCITPDGKYLLACDLGNDCLYQYVIDEIQIADRKGPLNLTSRQTLPMAPGSGPRQLKFSRNGRFGYLINELNGTINVFDYMAGRLKLKQTVRLADPLDEQDGIHGASELAITADQRFLYAANRGTYNQIVIFRLNEQGLLQRIAANDSGGIMPRHFCFTPSQEAIWIANQQSNNLQLFSRDPQTGLLMQNLMTINIEQPAFIEVLPFK